MAFRVIVQVARFTFRHAQVVIPDAPEICVRVTIGASTRIMREWGFSQMARFTFCDPRMVKLYRCPVHDVMASRTLTGEMKRVNHIGSWLMASFANRLRSGKTTVHMAILTLSLCMYTCERQ